MWVLSFYRLLLSNRVINRMRPVGFPLLLLLAVKCGVFFVPSESFLHDEVWALAAFKRVIFEDPLSVLSDWNTLDGDPCNWTGVICSKPQNHVLSLNLSSSSLKGFLVPELGSLSSLQELILRNNLFLGTIPKQIGMLKSLTILDLSLNRLTGSIPPDFGGLTSITKINLQSNGLTGNIPPELGKPKNLMELHLDRNRLKGPIPGSSNSSFSYSMFSSHNNVSGLCQSSQLRAGDFSYNFFVGKIPPCLKYLPRSSFQGNCFQDSYSVLQRSSQLCGSVKSQGVARETYKQYHEGNKHQNLQQPVWLLILEITTGVLAVVFLITGAVTAVKSCKLKTSVKIPWKRTMSWKDEIEISIDSEMLKNVPRLTRQELEVACEDFSNIIGSSPGSIVYKGTMKDGPEIAVVSLCISKDQWSSYLEFSFHSKVADLARLNHEITAKLLGYCKESDPFSRMLVFEYASNGTLYEHLHCESQDGDGCQLSWLRRMKIAIGVARGLEYLHAELQPPFTISDLNSSSVHLTEDFSPKLVDFESRKMIFSKSGKNSDCITNGGSFQRHADSLEQLNMDVHGNTYAFGVLLLELISGRPRYCKDRGCLVDWALKYLQNPEEISKLIDPELKNVKSDDIAVICSAVSLCIEPDPCKRPSMQIITSMLENGIDLSAAALLQESPLAWAELDLFS